MNQSKKAIDKIRSSLGLSTPTGQIFIGAASGLVTGYMTKKIGRPIAIAAGTGILAYQLAQSKGLVNLSWEQLREKAENAKNCKEFSQKGSGFLEKVKAFSKENTPFTAGFIGGFLIGVA